MSSECCAASGSPATKGDGKPGPSQSSVRPGPQTVISAKFFSDFISLVLTVYISFIYPSKAFYFVLSLPSFPSFFPFPSLPFLFLISFSKCDSKRHRYPRMPLVDILCCFRSSDTLQPEDVVDERTHLIPTTTTEDQPALWVWLSTAFLILCKLIRDS